MALRLAVAITGEAGGLREGMQTAGRELDRLAERGERAARRLAAGLDRAGRRMQAIGRGISDVGQRLSLAVTAPLLAIGAASIKTASDFQELRNLTAVTFGEAADDVKRWAERTAAALGRSRIELLRAAGDFAAFLKPLGVAPGMVVPMSQALSELVTDLSSFRNIAEADVFTALFSGLAGETEAVRRLGIDIGQAAIEAELLRLGFEGSADEASQAAKVIARYNLIIAQTRDAQGDAARTAGSFENQTRALGATVTDIRAEIGERLLPAATALVGRLIDLGQGFLAMSDGAQDTAVALAGVAAGIPLLLTGLGFLTQALGVAVRAFGVGLAATVAFGRGFGRVVRAIIVEVGLLAAAFATPVGAAIAMSTAVVAAAVGLRDTLAQIWQEIVNAARDWLIEQWNSRVLEPFVENVNRVRTAVGLEPIELPPLITTGEAARAVDEIDGQLKRLRAKLADVLEDLRAAGDDEEKVSFFNLIGEGIVLDIQELERRRQALAGVLPEGGAPTGTPSSRIAAAFERDMNRIRGEFQGVLDGIRAQLPDGLFDALFGDLDTVTPDIEEAERRLAELMAQLPAGGLPGALAGEGGDGGGAATLEELKQKLAELGGEVGKLPGQIEGVRDEIAELGRDVAEGITGPLREALRSGEQGFAGFRDAGIRIMSNLRDRLLDEIFKPIEDAIAKLFEQRSGGGGSGGGGGILGGIFGAIGSAIGGLFGGGLSGGVTTQATNPFNAPLFTASGSVALPSAMGNVFGPRGIVPFAKGGAFDPLGEVLTAPTLFRFADGAGFRAGVAGEAGDEAILPLRRGAGGRLGVEAAGLGRPAVVNIAGDTIVLQDSQTRPEQLKRIFAERDEKLKREVLEAVREAWVANPNAFPGS